MECFYNFKGNSYEEFLKIINKKNDENKINSKVPIIRIKQFFLQQSIRDYLIKVLRPHKKISQLSFYKILWFL